MKNLITRLAILVILISTGNASIAQCNDKSLKKECYEMLDNFIFVKSFTIHDNKAQYSYVFSRGTTYLITVCNEDDDDKMIVEIYDQNKKKIASNYQEKKDFYSPKIAYKCNATGVYYMKYYFKENKDNCGISVIGFKK